MTDSEAAARIILNSHFFWGEPGQVDTAIAAMLAHTAAALAEQFAKNAKTLAAERARYEEGAREMRERAAKVAEEQAARHEEAGRFSSFDYYLAEDASNAIAAAIRALDPAAREDREVGDA